MVVHVFSITPMTFYKSVSLSFLPRTIYGSLITHWNVLKHIYPTNIQCTKNEEILNGKLHFLCSDNKAREVGLEWIKTLRKEICILRLKVYCERLATSSAPQMQCKITSHQMKYFSVLHIIKLTVNRRRGITLILVWNPVLFTTRVLQFTYHFRFLLFWSFYRAFFATQKNLKLDCANLIKVLKILVNFSF